MRRVARALVVLVLSLVVASLAKAHTMLERAEPRVGSTVRAAPAQVRLWFSESLEPAFSTARVINGTGEQVDKGDAQVEPSAPKQLRLSLPPISPGTYKVIWRVVSVDTHVTKGTFPFTIAP